MPSDNIQLWGLGIEAEFALFHDPKVSMKESKQNPHFLFFDPQKGFEKPMTRFYYYFYTKPPPKDKKLLFFPPRVHRALDLSQDIDVEHAGKVCKGRTVVGKNYDYVYYLLEARTDEPFSGKDYGKRYMDRYTQDLQDSVKNFIQTYRKYRPEYQREDDKKFGQPTIYPYGMSSRIRLRNLNTNKFVDGPTIDNYTGSYHFTFTLPHQYPGSCSTLSQNHKYFANMIQWVEPLLATSYHSCDDRSIGSREKYTKGSFRVVMAGWGDFGGSDVRRIRCVKGRKKVTSEAEKETLSLTRYASHKVKWRDRLPFKDIELLDPCRNDLKSLTFQSSLGADFRTPYMRFQEGRKIYDLQALEVRIFDWFNPKHLTSLGTLLVLIAERSRTVRVNKYVYNNDSWNKAVRNVMIHGWNAILDQRYIQDLEKVYEMKIEPKTLRARDVFDAFVKSLFEVTKGGEWIRLLLRRIPKKYPKQPNVNRRSWENGYVLYLMEDQKRQDQLKRFLRSLDPNMDGGSLKASYMEHFGKKWEDDFVDILGFLETLKILKLDVSYDGEIERVRVDKTKMRRLDNLWKVWMYFQTG